MFSSCTGLWPGAELYILLFHWVGHWVGHWVSHKAENICQHQCQDSEIWHEAPLDTFIKIQEEPNRRTMWGTYLGNKRVIFGLSVLYLCSYLFEMVQISTEKLWLTIKALPCNIKLLGPYQGHFWAILVPYYSFFCYIFASTCLNGSNFHWTVLQGYKIITMYHFIIDMLFDHVLAIFSAHLLQSDWKG